MLKRLMLSLLACGLVSVCSLQADEKGKKDKKDPQEGRKGRVIGIVTKKEKNWIEVQAPGEEKARRYFPRWTGGLPKDGGGFEKSTLAAFKKLKVKDKVQIEWMFEERLRVIKIKTLGKKPEKEKSKG